MKLINLLPKNQQKQVRLHFFAEHLISFWVAVVVSLIIFLSLTFTAKIKLEGQVTNLDSQITFDKQILKSSDNELLKEKINNLNSDIALINQIESQHYYFSKALAELANLLSTDIQLDQFSLDRSSGKIDIRGVAASRDSVLKFWSDIHKSQIFKDINFPLANLNSATNDSFGYTFYINYAAIKQ